MAKKDKKPAKELTEAQKNTEILRNHLPFHNIKNPHHTTAFDGSLKTATKNLAEAEAALKMRVKKAESTHMQLKERCTDLYVANMSQDPRAMQKQNRRTFKGQVDRVMALEKLYEGVDKVKRAEKVLEEVKEVKREMK